MKSLVFSGRILVDFRLLPLPLANRTLLHFQTFKLILLSVHFSTSGRKSSFYWLIVDMVDISYKPEGPPGEQLKWWKQRVNKLVQWGELMALPLFHHGREETWVIWSVCPAACIWRALQRMRASNPKLLKGKQGHVFQIAASGWVIGQNLEEIPDDKNIRYFIKATRQILKVRIGTSLYFRSVFL